MWAPSRALYSAHSGYNSYAWGDIQNTLSGDEVNADDLREPNGVQNGDHPKAYIGWSKHPFFDDRNTGWNDPASQSLDNAFRSDDWWYFVDSQYYVSCPLPYTATWCLPDYRSSQMTPRLLDRLLEQLIGEVLTVILPKFSLGFAMLHKFQWNLI